MKRKKRTSSNISIKLAREADLSSIKPLLLDLMEAMENKEGFEVKRSLENCHSLIKDPASHILLAKDKDAVVGFIDFTIRKTMLHPGPSGLIDELIVSKNYRGFGIGKRLILAAIKECRELGCCEVEVSTEKSNTQAREFYQSCGFEEDAVLLEINLED